MAEVVWKMVKVVWSVSDGGGVDVSDGRGSLSDGRGRVE